MRHPPRTIAGADISVPRFGRRAVAAVVVLSFPDLEVVEESLVAGELRFPYIPGFLSFREGPLLEEALLGLARKPGLVLFDGQGIAHPRGLGIASHLGLRLQGIADLPILLHSDEKFFHQAIVNRRFDKEP